MKVLYIPHDSNMMGGANYALLEILDGWRGDLNVTPIVLVPFDNGDLITELDKRNIKYIVCHHEWWVHVKAENVLRNAYRHTKIIVKQLKMRKNLNLIVSKLSDIGIDIIHSNSSVVNIGGILSSKMKIPHIWHVREFGEEHLNFQFLYGTKKSREYMQNNSSKVVLISKALSKKYEKYVDREKIKCIYDGVSSKYDNPIINNKDNNEFKILITGSIHRGKSQLEVVESAINLINKGFNIKLFLAGLTYDKDYLNEIMNKIKSNKLEEKIIYFGEVKEINELRSNINLEVICSYMEAFGRVTVEAMLSKIPVIVSNSGANIELVNEDLNGLIYEKGDVEDLSNKIQLLINNPELCKKFGENGYKYAKKNFNSNNNCLEIFNLYKEVIKKEN